MAQPAGPPAHQIRSPKGGEASAECGRCMATEERTRELEEALREIVSDFEVVERKRKSKNDPRDYVSERLAGYAYDALGSSALSQKDEYCDTCLMGGCPIHVDERCDP